MISPHIIDIRWRIASEEKVKRCPPAQQPWGNWHIHKQDGRWGIAQIVHHHGRDALLRFIETTEAEFNEVNSRYKDAATLDPSQP